MKMEAQIQMIPIAQLLPNSFQPRLEFDQEEIDRLANSIKVHGIIQPLTVRRVNDKYELISGERRVKAAQQVGLSQVPCIICVVDENEASEVSIVEKLHAKDLTAIEEAKCYKKLLDKGYTNETLSERMNIPSEILNNKLRLLNLSQPVQDALQKGKISEKHAKALLKILDPNRQIELLEDVMNSRLTVKQLNDKIDIELGVKSIEDIGDELNINDKDISFRPNEYQYDSSLKDNGKTNLFFNNLENAPVSMDDPTLAVGDNPFLGEQRFNESGIIDLDDTIDEIDTPEEEVVKKDEINLNITNNKELLDAIHKVIDKAKENEVDIKTEEFDFNDINQIIIKVSKQKKEEQLEEVKE